MRDGGISRLDVFYPLRSVDNSFYRLNWNEQLRKFFGEMTEAISMAGPWYQNVKALPNERFDNKKCNE